jgi:protein-S-isoprenylcysteine O-methyltransferase Ste14
MITIGNFFFRYRNGLFPVFYALLFVSSAPVFPDFRVAAVIGFFIAGLGQALRAVTIGLEYIVRGGRNRRVYADNLVTGGMFAHCRNPLYVGNFLIVVGLVVASNSLFSFVVITPLFAFIYWAIVAAEENYLLGKFGPAFTDYCARVNRFLPRFKDFRNTISGMTYNWRRLVTAEYGSTYIWIAGIIAVTFRNAARVEGFSWSDPLLVFLLTAFLVATFGYALARVLKKGGFLATPEQAGT